jgi:asparagine synthase (glutamine-hydrolysing)
MCGIAGVYSLDESCPAVTSDQLYCIRETLRHRGPDDAGFYHSEDQQIGLGFRRLSILDLSLSGHQPMALPDQSLHIVFNGEIYNYRQLRAELQQQGVSFHSSTDTEVLLHLYKMMGPKMLHRLVGMFAMAIWDAEQRTLWLARDRIGVKPLYYATKGKRFFFASEIKAILAHESFTPAVNQEALYHYLTLLTTPPPMTLFEGICKLPAGHTLTIHADGRQQLEEYWDVFTGAEAYTHLREKDLPAAILDLLRDSIQLHMVSDVPVGVFLSGGLDSSTLVALMSQMLDRPVRTFSIGYEADLKYTELHHARRIAEMYGTEHHEIRISEQQSLSFLPNLIHHQDEPIADPVCIPLYFLANLARENGVTVCQVGEGSDELFGYPAWNLYLAAHQGGRLVGRLPGWARRGLIAAVEHWHGRRRPYEYLGRVHKDQIVFWGNSEAYGEGFKEQLLSESYFRQHAEISTYSIIQPYYQRFLDRTPHHDFFNFMTYLEMHLRLPELLLMRVDKMTMAASLESRVPFLDHRLVTLIASQPQRWKIKWGQPKYLLKKIMEPILPSDVIYRKKQGFGVPIDQWFRAALGRLSRESLNRKLPDLPYFKKGAAKQLLESSKPHRSWFLLNFILWHEYWIEGNRRFDEERQIPFAPLSV